MAGHSHDDHQIEQKPVAFTVPFILAAVTLIIIFLFLSLCDPKAGHHGEAHHGMENPAHANFHGDVHNPNAAPADHAPKGDAATSDTHDQEGAKAGEAGQAENAHH